MYDDNTGIKLTPDAAGLCIVRAIAVTPGKIPSELFLSKSASLSLFLFLAVSLPPLCLLRLSVFCTCHWLLTTHHQVVSLYMFILVLKYLLIVFCFIFTMDIICAFFMLNQLCHHVIAKLYLFIVSKTH